MKYIILDSGPLISLAMNGLLNIIESLSQILDGEFIITPDVKREVIDHPLIIKKYELEAIKVKNLLDRRIIKESKEFVQQRRLEKEKKKILQEANSIFQIRKTKEKIKIIQDGEASCLAFAKLCNCDNLIVVDERTTRLLIESPDNLKELMQRKLHSTISMNTKLAKQFRNFKIIRSTELAFIAFEKNLIGLGKDKKVLEAVLYGLKFKGTAISSQEIEQAKKLIRKKTN